MLDTLSRLISDPANPPSTLQMYQALGGEGDDLVELIARCDRHSTADLVALFGAGAVIGYYYALQELTAVRGDRPC